MDCRTLLSAGVFSLSGFLACGPVAAQSADQAPSPARGVEVVIYSGTAAGVRWRRASDDRGVRGYEIYREGEFVGEVDALSYIASDYVPGAINNISVVSVDTAGQRSAASTGIAFSTPGGGVAVTPPDTPTLRAAVYSSTGAGLAWSRPTENISGVTRVSQYEVRRDGVLVATTRNPSYIDTTLAAGRRYLYEVVAINAQGGRAEPARVAVTAAGTSSDGEGSDGDPQVAAPSGLRSVAYSTFAGGIAWDRPATPGFRYEVLRDGTSLGTSSGVSYVDESLSPGQDFLFDVIAIDPQGRRSAASSVTLNTSDAGGSAPTPTPAPAPPAAAVPTLDDAADGILVSMAGYQAEIKAANIQSIAGIAMSTAIGSRELPAPDTGVADQTGRQVAASSSAVEYDCAFGGRMVVESIDVTIRGDGDDDRDIDAYRFDQCRVEANDSSESVIDGEVEVKSLRISGNRFDQTTETYTWSDFSLVGDAPERLDIDGSISIELFNSDRPESTRTVAFSRYEEVFDDSRIERLEDTSLVLRTAREGPYDDYSLVASGTVVNRSTEGLGVRVDSPEALTRRYGATYESNITGMPFAGRLEFTAEDGRSLAIEVLDTWTEGFRVDRRHTASDGSVRVREGVPFQDLSVQLPERG